MHGKEITSGTGLQWSAFSVPSVTEFQTFLLNSDCFHIYGCRKDSWENVKMSGLCSDTRHYFTRIWGNAAGGPGGWHSVMQQWGFKTSSVHLQMDAGSESTVLQNFWLSWGCAQWVAQAQINLQHRESNATAHSRVQDIAQGDTKGRLQLPQGGLCFRVILWSPRQQQPSLWWLPTLSGLTGDPRTPKSFVILHQTAHEKIPDRGFTAKCKYYKARAPTGCCWGQRWPFRMKVWDTAGQWWEAHEEMWLDNLQHTANIRLSYTFTHLRRHQGQSGWSRAPRFCSWCLRQME